VDLASVVSFSFPCEWDAVSENRQVYAVVSTDGAGWMPVATQVAAPTVEGEACVLATDAGVVRARVGVVTRVAFRRGSPENEGSDGVEEATLDDALIAAMAGGGGALAVLLLAALGVCRCRKTIREKRADSVEMGGNQDAP
jgi:hypothetical protein